MVKYPKWDIFFTSVPICDLYMEVLRKMKIREMPDWEMPREKLLHYGSSSLSTAELLAIIIRTGSSDKSAVELAHELMALDKNGLRYLVDCAPEELMRVKGMGLAKACQVIAAVELGKRIAATPPLLRETITGSVDIAEIFMEKLRYEKKEHFICLMLNSKGEILEETEVSIGDLSSSVTHPREVFARAIKRSAGSVAFVHNHPSGTPQPSQADIDTTKRLIEVGNLVGIPVIDHIIIGDGEFISMKAQGII